MSPRVSSPEGEGRDTGPWKDPGVWVGPMEAVTALNELHSQSQKTEGAELRFQTAAMGWTVAGQGRSPNI